MKYSQHTMPTLLLPALRSLAPLHKTLTQTRRGKAAPTLRQNIGVRSHSPTKKPRQAGSFLTVLVMVLPTLRSPSLQPLLCPCIANAQDPPHKCRSGGFLHWQPPAIASGTGTEPILLQGWHKTHAYVNMPRLASHVVVVPSCSFLTLPALPPLAHWLLRWRCLRRWRQNKNQQLIIAMKDSNTDSKHHHQILSLSF